MAEKWYSSYIGEGLGVGLIITSFGLMALLGFKGCNHKEIEKYRIDKQVQVQRLETIKEITRQYGNKMEPNDLSKFLKEHNLDK